MAGLSVVADGCISQVESIGLNFLGLTKECLS